MKKVRLTAIVIASVLVFVFLIAQIALTGANGGLLEFLRGQSSPSITLEHGPAKATGQPIQVGIEIATGQIIHETAPEYLSFALDTSQIVGGKWWDPAAKGVEVGSGDVHAPIFNFDRPRFANLVKALAPAVLRIGGSEADKVFYDMQASKGDRPEPPAGYKSVLTPEMFDNVTAFVRGIPGLKLQFTLNAGPSARNDNGEWDGTNARTLLAYAKRNGRHVDYWELGNELNLYWFMYGPSKVVSAEQYAKDMEVARQEVLDFFPDAYFSGQGSAFWPILGEPLQIIYGFMEQYLEEVANRTDIVSWHYYPQQSRRGPVQSRKAAPGRLLNPDNLDEAAHWAKAIVEWRDKYAPERPIWLGETGNAQFGGEPGVSDAYIGGLWWLDQLGLLATMKHDVVVRQTITGMNYGMLASDSLNPLPDYWNSLLWKRLMGTKVLSVTKSDADSESGEGLALEFRKIRIYAHCAKDRSGGITVLAINLNQDRAAQIEVPQFSGLLQEAYVVTTDDVLGKSLRINNIQPGLDEAGRLPAITGHASRPDSAQIELAPLGYGFLVLPEADAPVCRLSER